MTGIERLRELTDKYAELGKYHTTIDVVPGGMTMLFSNIADQIERERACDEDTIENVRLIVGGVIDDMERHVLGHESMEDSPVARWARELRRALGGHVEEVTDVATIRKDAYDAYEWVREHGGLDAMVELSSRLMTVDALRAAIEETCTRIGVEHTGDLTQDAQAIWREIGALRSRLKESVPRAAYERHLARRQRQIDESHAALRRRNQRIAVLESEINRAHNENRMEFMRRAGNFTAFADEVCKRLAPQLRYVEGCTKDVMDAALEALDRRLMPEGMEWMLWDDGKPVTYDDAPDDVIGVYLALDGSGYVLMTDLPDQLMSEPSDRVKRPSVLAADGEPLEVGQTVWDVKSGIEYEVVGIHTDEDTPVRVMRTDGSHLAKAAKPSSLTHQRPVLAADGEPLEVGQTVYGTRDLEPVEIVSLRSKEYDGVRTVKCKDRTGFVFYAPNDLIHHRPVLDADGVPIELGDDLYSVEGSLKLHVSNIDRANCRIATSAMFALDKWADPSMFTHTKPEIDTWERIEEDLGDEMAKQQCGPISPELACKLAGDFVRRCRALAKRGE